MPTLEPDDQGVKVPSEPAQSAELADLPGQVRRVGSTPSGALFLIVPVLHQRPISDLHGWARVNQREANRG